MAACSNLILQLEGLSGTESVGSTASRIYLARICTSPEGATMSSKTELQELQMVIQKFAEDRDWEQFHSPKNLAMALSAEAGELLERFQWLTEENSQNLDEDRLRDVQEEIGDVFIYLLRIADRLDIDLFEAARSKIAINEKKYPADLVRGSAAKYSEYGSD